MLALCLLLCGCTLFARPRTVKYIEYPIQRGDTLRSISERFGVPSAEILSANSVSFPRELKIGQTIIIPYREKPAGRKLAARGEAIRTLPRDAASVKIVRTNPAGRLVGSLTWPVAGGPVSSLFGKRWFSFHEGVDIPAPVGVPVLAAQAGTVVYSGDGLKGYGNLVVIKGENLMTVYAHNYLNVVRAGEKVQRGQKIAEVGETGHATGPHLHFETRVKDSAGKNAAIDPLVFFPVVSSKS